MIALVGLIVGSLVLSLAIMLQMVSKRDWPPRLVVPLALCGIGLFLGSRFGVPAGKVEVMSSSLVFGLVFSMIFGVSVVFVVGYADGVQREIDTSDSVDR